MGIVRLAQSSSPSKTTFKRLLQKLVHIVYDNENDEYNDDNGNTIDDFDKENYQKNRQISQVYSQKVPLLGIITKTTGQGSTPSHPPNGHCPVKIISLVWMSSLTANDER